MCDINFHIVYVVTVEGMSVRSSTHLFDYHCKMAVDSAKEIARDRRVRNMNYYYCLRTVCYCDNPIFYHFHFL